MVTSVKGSNLWQVGGFLLHSSTNKTDSQHRSNRMVTSVKGSNLWQVGGFSYIPPPIKLTATPQE
jgi:hypothetical protein